MKLTFDHFKRSKTLLERGIDFADATVVFAGHHITGEDVRQDYGEVRFISVGMLTGGMVVIVWAPRGKARHIISMNTSLNTKTTWADPDDAPELTDAFFRHAAEFKGATRIRRRRPKADVVPSNNDPV